MRYDTQLSAGGRHRPPPGAAEVTGARCPEGLGSAVVRVRSADGAPVGSGFLLAPGTVATCAHVVAQALRTDARAESPPTSPVTVEFPLHRGSAAFETSVSAWLPLAADGTGDIALLRLPEHAAVADTPPVPLAGAGDVWEHRFRILAFPASAEHGAWIGGRLLGAVGQGWISMEADGTAHHISPGCSGAPVWDEELGAVIGMTVATDRGRTAATSYLIPAATLLDLQPGLRRCPYRGLDAFREEDAEHFFGREKETERLLEAVDRHVVVPVVGPSGSGKTSLVRAGALPRLRADGHTVSEIRPLPGTPAALTLARALAPLLEPDQGVAIQERTAQELADLLDTGAAPALGLRLLHHCGPRGHVFFLNQLEEIVAGEPATARSLLALLIALSSVPAEDKRLRVLATLRSACLDDLAEPATAHVLSDCAQVVAPLGRAGLLRAVEGPASRVPGLTLDPGLAQRIVDDAQDEPGHLPMVEFALTELWSLQGGVRLTHTGYEVLGGVSGALSTHAEKRVGEVIAEHGEAPVRRLFVQLARPDDSGGFTRKPARLTHLPSEIRSVAEALATRTRFVRITHGPDGEPLVDLAHEELVRAWPRLRAWLEDSRDFRQWQERLRQAMDDWKATGEETGALLRGTMLATSLEQLADPRHGEDITPSERAYVDLSRRHQQRALHRWRLAASVLVVLALLAGGLAVESWRRGNALETRGRTIASRTLAEEAGRLAGTHPVASVRMAMAAWYNARGREARQALLEAYLRGSSVVAGVAGPRDEQIQSLDTTADGSTVVTVSTGRGNTSFVRVWTGIPEGRARSWKVPGRPHGVVSMAELSDDGRLLAVAWDDGSVQVHDLPRREHLWTRPALDAEPLPPTAALDFSDGGERLLRLAAYGDGTEETDRRDWSVEAWQSDTGQPVTVARHGAAPVDAALVGDGTDAVYMTAGGEEGPGVATVRRLASGKELRTLRKVAGLVGRGSGVMVDRKHGRYALESLTGSGTIPPTVPIFRQEGVDSTGRYALDHGGSDGNAVVWATELLTGRRYRAPAGLLATAAVQPAAVITRKEGTPYILRPQGSDLLVLRTTEDSRFPLPSMAGGWGSDETYARSADGVRRARLDSPETLGGVPQPWLILARRGQEMAAKPLVLDEWTGTGVVEPNLFFTADSRRLVLWSSGHERLSVREAARGAAEFTEKFSSPVVFAAPLYGSEAVVLTAERLIVFDVESGEERAIAARPCGNGSCMGFGVRPGRTEVAVADSDGRVFLWNVDTGEKRRIGDFTMGSGHEEELLAFSPNGSLIATPSDARTVVRRKVADGEPMGRTVESDGEISVKSLADDGTLVTDESPLKVWRAEDTDEPYVDVPGYAAAPDIRLTSDHMTVEQANDVVRIPLAPEAWIKALCRNWSAPYTPAEQRILTDAGADTGSPCS
ncbi:trypsin-like peptidase domain-containing protein [Streptomyces coeruleorubidus]|uniref:nSTAND1 domain-containing NTPase n=1 Tax=Streptomyces coeruleorubidus TaxID=116188 RepID=UPI00237FB261|nr:trypsin-like peptidase domain-containing protein [Streptomyces coeruleorubidus]WDV50740.1 trypsin-like peptidase domain-containing protein [Streptomyces coeruleorubidus]